MSTSDLPALNAVLNGTSAVLLLAGWVAIRTGNRRRHARCMGAAFVVSGLFLVSYLTYHFTTQGVTRFRDPAWFRPAYLLILLTHTVLAVPLVPLVLMTLQRARRERFEAHRRLARWVWPIWMYVSVTGVVVYLMLYQWFPGPPSNG